jgi:hypothetical protein
MTTSNFKLAGLHCTYRILNQGTRNNASFQVVLPNGRNVELFSKEGADECVGVVGTDFISTSLTATNDVELSFTYLMMLTVIGNVSPEKIASGIPESELRTFVEHTLDTLDTLSTDSNWLVSGTLNQPHELLLQTDVAFSKQPSFVKVCFSSEGMEAVAKFYASRGKNDTRNHKVAQMFLHLSIMYFLSSNKKKVPLAKNCLVPWRKRVFLDSSFAAFLSIPDIPPIL